MKNLILLTLIGIVPSLLFGGDKTQKELCAVGLSECNGKLKCIPSVYD
ncbi:MAG: hypothetical protein HYV97_08175 [Bdellovibrio sp.]|nr:hypothetical protein [Bdellovibrio sp.]